MVTGNNNNVITPYPRYQYAEKAVVDLLNGSPLSYWIMVMPWLIWTLQVAKNDIGGSLQQALGNLRRYVASICSSNA